MTTQTARERIDSELQGIEIMAIAQLLMEKAFDADLYVEITIRPRNERNEHASGIADQISTAFAKAEGGAA